MAVVGKHTIFSIVEFIHSTKIIYFIHGLGASSCWSAFLRDMASSRMWVTIVNRVFAPTPFYYIVFVLDKSVPWRIIKSR